MEAPRMHFSSLLVLALVLWMGHTAQGRSTQATPVTSVPDQCELYAGVKLAGLNVTNTMNFTMIYAGMRDYTIDFHRHLPDGTLAVGTSPTEPLRVTQQCDLNNIFIRHTTGYGFGVAIVALESFLHPRWFVKSTPINGACANSRHLILGEANETWNREKDMPPAFATDFTFKIPKFPSNTEERMEYTVNETKFRVVFDLGHIRNGSARVRSRLSNGSRPDSSSLSCSTAQGIDTLSLEDLKIDRDPQYESLFKKYYGNARVLCEDIRAKTYPGQCFESCLFALSSSHCSARCTSKTAAANKRN